MILYHVTDQENASEILKDGFLGGWGDVGFGVYFYGNVHEARSYGQRGGWDGKLVDPVILEVEVGDLEVDKVVPHPEWPNPEAYNDVWYREMPDGPDDEDTPWAPKRVGMRESVEMTKKRARHSNVG